MKCYWTCLTEGVGVEGVDSLFDLKSSWLKKYDLLTLYIVGHTTKQLSKINHSQN